MSKIDLIRKGKVAERANQPDFEDEEVEKKSGRKAKKEEEKPLDTDIKEDTPLEPVDQPDPADPLD